MPLMAYLFKIDREKWEHFKEAATSQGHTMKWMLEQYIDDVIAKRRASKQPPQKDKKP